MNHQFLSVLTILLAPRQTLRSLPHDRLYSLAILGPLYFGYARGVRTGAFEKLTVAFGSSVAVYAFFLVIVLGALPLSALVFKLIVRLFGKRLTVKKIMNIYGYSLVPRLVVALIGAGVLAISSDTQMAVAQGKGSVMLISLAVIGIITLLYSIVLFIMGLVVSPPAATDIA